MKTSSQKATYAWENAEKGLMNSYRQQFLNILHLPGRLTDEETSWFIGFNLYDIFILALAGLLKPLGQPVPNAIKYFDLATLCELKQDSTWQYRATKEIMGHSTAETVFGSNVAPHL